MIMALLEATRPLSWRIEVTDPLNRTKPDFCQGDKTKLGSKVGYI